MSEAVKLFIGSSTKGEDEYIEKVYVHSLIKNASAPIEIHWMRQTRNQESPWYGFSTSRWSTPFSGFRWAIPELCEFKGRAIYTDVDMINFRDINELFTIDMNGKPIAARKGSRFGGHEFCVMVLDCEQLQEYLIPISRQKIIPDYHHRCIASFSGNESLVHELDPRWNCLDGENLAPEEIWQLHWTNMETQPWSPAWYKGLSGPHPRRDLVTIMNQLHSESGIQLQYETDFGEYDIIGK